MCVWSDVALSLSSSAENFFVVLHQNVDTERRSSHTHNNKWNTTKICKIRQGIIIIRETHTMSEECKRKCKHLTFTTHDGREKKRRFTFPKRLLYYEPNENYHIVCRVYGTLYAYFCIFLSSSSCANSGYTFFNDNRRCLSNMCDNSCLMHAKETFRFQCFTYIHFNGHSCGNMMRTLRLCGQSS